MNGRSDFSYFNAGWRQYGRIPVLPYQRGEWEIQAILEGNCRIQFPNHRWLEAPAGTLWVFQPDCAHGWTDEDDASRCRMVVFHTRDLPLLLKNWMRDRSFFETTLSPAEMKKTEQFGEECPEILSLPPPLRQLRVESVLLELSYMLLKDQGLELPSSESRNARLAAQCLHWMGSHLQEGCRVEEAAAAMHLSPQHLRRIFLQETGKRPGQELTRLRIERAKEYLGTADYSLEEISEAVGYSCAAALSRAFRTETGMTPGAFRIRMAKSFRA